MTGGTNFGSIPNYSTRGFGGNNVTIMRDGIRQNTASQSSRTVDSFILDRIEILKGPDGLMFGEGAIGGAVNYISKNPSPSFRSDLIASYGGWGSYRVGLGVGGPLKGTGFNYRADYAHNYTNGYQDRNSQRYDALALSVGWRANEKLSLTWFGTFLDDWNESYYGSPTIYDAVINTTVAGALPEVRTFVSTTDRMINPRVDPAARRTNYNILDNYAATENVFNRLRTDLRLTPEIELRNEAYVATQLLKWRNEESNTWNPVAKNITRGALTLIYRDDVLLGDRLDLTIKQPIAGHANRLLIGAVFERNDQIRGGAPGNVTLTIPAVTLLNPNVGYGPAAPFKKTSRIGVETHAFHLQDVFDVTSNFRAVLGLRYDHISLQRDTPLQQHHGHSNAVLDVQERLPHHHRPHRRRLDSLQDGQRLRLLQPRLRARDPARLAHHHERRLLPPKRPAIRGRPQGLLPPKQTRRHLRRVRLGEARHPHLHARPRHRPAHQPTDRRAEIQGR
jgi:iron complex outermembrane receptor protein